MRNGTYCKLILSAKQMNAISYYLGIASCVKDINPMNIQILHEQILDKMEIVEIHDEPYIEEEDNE